MTIRPGLVGWVAGSVAGGLLLAAGLVVLPPWSGRVGDGGVLLVTGLACVLAGAGGAALAGRHIARSLRARAGLPDGNDDLVALGEDLARLAAVLEERDAGLREAREQLRSLSAYLESAREGERKRIARDIHDDLGQALSALRLDLSLLRDELGDPTPRVGEKIDAMTGLVASSMRSVKRIISQLRPQVLDDLGLTAALEWEAEEFQKRTAIPVELSIYPQEIILEPDQSTALFRIFQETLANVARHARAQSVRASLTEIDGVVELDVRDDGRGITPAQIADPRSFGLIGIRERAHAWDGSVAIEGSPGQGTRVRVRFELREEP